MTDTTTTSTPTRATWKQHGRPTALEFFGTEVKVPASKGVVAHKIVIEDNTVKLKARNGRVLEGGAFGVATKFWAVVPEDAKQPEPVREPKTPTVKLAPVVITAAKGGDTTVEPKKGAIAKAIKATGKSIMAISREHGLNPSQMRRLSLDTVAKVDTVRAEQIAKALGVPMAQLFGDETGKAKAATPPPATTGSTTRRGGGKSKATKAAEQTAKDQAAREAAEADQAKAEADQAGQAAEGSQAEPEVTPAPETTTTETPAAE
jgi:lambda repressor-like predicted transcriptional regulator